MRSEKARIFALYQILKRYTDDTHGISINEMLTRLDKDYGIKTTRHTVENDLSLFEFPLDIELETSFDTPIRYSLLSRGVSFEDILSIYESLQQNPYLPNERKLQILESIKENLCSIHEAKELTMNAIPLEEDTARPDKELQDKLNLITQAIEEKLFIWVNAMHYTIVSDHLESNITSHWVLPLYQYRYNNKDYIFCIEQSRSTCDFRALTHYGRPVEGNPPIIFEVDKISDIQLSRKMTSRTVIPDNDTIRETVRNHNYSIYESTVEKISMDFDKDLLPLIYDRFGKNIQIEEAAENRLHLVTETNITPEFFAWLFSLGTGAKLLSPLHVTQRMKRWIKSFSDLYGVSSKS